MTDRIESWDDFFMELAKTYARRSKDPSTRVGAVIVGPNHEQRSGGYNGLPRGVDDSRPERWSERPGKYAWCEHAERNAIYNAARVGIACDGCTLYVAGLPPCPDCARAIIQAGIREVVHGSVYCHFKRGTLDHPYNPEFLDHPTRCICGREENDHIPERWRGPMELALEMLREAGVVVRGVRL